MSSSSSSSSLPSYSAEGDIREVAAAARAAEAEAAAARGSGAAAEPASTRADVPASASSSHGPPVASPLVPTPAMLNAALHEADQTPPPAEAANKADFDPKLPPAQSDSGAVAGDGTTTAGGDGPVAHRKDRRRKTDQSISAAAAGSDGGAGGDGGDAAFAAADLSATVTELAARLGGVGEALSGTPSGGDGDSRGLAGESDLEGILNVDKAVLEDWLNDGAKEAIDFVKEMKTPTLNLSAAELDCVPAVRWGGCVCMVWGWLGRLAGSVRGGGKEFNLLG